MAMMLRLPFIEIARCCMDDGAEHALSGRAGSTNFLSGIGKMP